MRKNVLKKVLWIFISLLGAVSLAIVIGIINPQEKINALWIVVSAACIYAITYRYYSAFLAAKVFCLDGGKVTPAEKLKDGTDYHPTNRWILFGHHFAAIAGAGPLIGPMLAAQFGFLPGFLWMLIGAALAGAVHDMVILIASVRKNGRSLAQIAREDLGPFGSAAVSIAILFIIIIALAGLGLTVVNALTNSPWGTFTIAATIPAALFMGLYMYRIRPGKTVETTVIGVSVLILAVIGGHFIPGSPLESVFSLSRNSLIIAMAAYGFIASVLPVWMLLCPRDYLSTYMKIGTVTLLAIGVVFMAPVLQMPPVTKFIYGGGPVIPGKLFPFMFITIACGAISGFHALISSGTTPKMIKSENDIRFIGFGAMLTEGFVGIIAIIAASIIMPGDYFAINTKLTFDQIAALGFPVQHVKELSDLVQVNIVGRPGGAVSLAVGMASILGKLPGMKGLMPYWYNFALMFEALFILTTVDTGTRVARFMVQEFGSRIYKPLAKQTWKPGIIVTSLLVVLAWSYLIFSGNISTIWPMFGVANQLLAAIALGVGTTVIIKSNKVKYAWTTFIPMVFMYVTTLTASWQLIGMYGASASKAVNPSDVFTYRLDTYLIVFMMILAVVSLGDMVYRWVKFLKAPGKHADSNLTAT